MDDLPDNATPVMNTGDKFAAYVSRNGDTAYVMIFARLPGHRIDFSKAVADYETLSKGAAASARREIRKLTTSAVVDLIAGVRIISLTDAMVLLMLVSPNDGDDR